MDGLAIRTGQLRSTRPRLTRPRRRLRIDREALAVALRGPAPRGASCDGPPAPRRLEQPLPCTSPISDVPRRRRVHRLIGSRADGKHPQSLRSPPHRPLQSDASNGRNAFHRVATERVSPSGEARGPPGRWLRTPSRTVLTSEPPPRASARAAVSSSASVAPSIRLAAPRAERRAMRRTDVCRLTSSYEHPRLVGSRGRPALARLRHRGVRLLHGSAIRFGGPHVLLVSTAPGVVFPARRVRSEPLAPCRLSHVCDGARATSNRGSRRDRRYPVRVNGAGRKRRSGVPSIGRGPSPCNALSSIRLRPGPGTRFGHRGTVRRRLSPARTLSDPRGPGSRARAPAANGKRASWSLGVARRLLQPHYDARAHPTSVRSSHASGAFAPLLAGTNGCRLRWPPRCVAAPRACEPRSARDGFRTPRSTRVDGTESRAGALERRRAARVGTRVPSSWRSGHPGHRSESPRALERLVARRTGRDPPRMLPREGRHRWKDRGAFYRDGILTRAGDGSLVRARTGAPSRHLRGGIARELARLFHRFRRACL